MQTHTIQIPAYCPKCGFPNYNITGLRQNGETHTRVSCMRCGKPHTQ